MKAKILMMVITSLISFNAMAVTIDYRHEMQDTVKKDHKDRLLMSHRFDNGFGVSLEAKWKQLSNDNTSDKPYSETVSNGAEVTASYLHQLNETFGVEGAFNIVSDDKSSNYRTYIKGTVNITDSLYYGLRYRPFYQRYSGNIGGPNTHLTGYTITNTLGYKLPANLTLEYEFEYNKNTRALEAGNFAYISDKDNDGITHNVKLSYKADKNWMPYMEVGNVVGSKMTDERQTRYRVGVQYNF